jgi:tetratricopeptide (TPR) repeat protein
VRVSRTRSIRATVLALTLAACGDASVQARAPSSPEEVARAVHDARARCAAAATEGRSADALGAAREAAAIATPGPTEYAFALPSWVFVRFGRFEEALQQARPPPERPVATAAWHFVRGLALADLGRFREASAAAVDLATSMSDVPDEAAWGASRARRVLSLAHRVLTAELAQRTGQLDQALGLFQAAAEAEDALPPSDPPDWFEPVRHRLGALLLFLGRASEAEAVYREDLRRNPENGWSLFGLERALSLQEKSDEAADVAARFRKAWARADVTLTASRF